MSVATTYEHITLNQNGIALIEGTSTKVSELVVETKAYGWSPEEIHFQHPYLSLGQIYSALAYYHDHFQDFERELKERLENIEAIKGSVGESKVRNILKEKGLL